MTQICPLKGQVQLLFMVHVIGVEVRRIAEIMKKQEQAGEDI